MSFLRNGASGRLEEGGNTIERKNIDTQINIIEREMREFQGHNLYGRSQ